MSAEPFELYYSIADVAERLRIAPSVIRRDVMAGAFGPVGPSGGLFFRGRELRIPWSRVRAYLLGHSSRPAAAVAAAEKRLRILAASRGDAPRAVSGGVSARTLGELARKLDATRE